MELDLSEFPSNTYDEWRAEAEASLKGAPFDKKLVGRTFEGIDIQPIYNASDVAGLPHTTFPGFSPFVRGTEPGGYRRWPWEVAQHISESSARDFNGAARRDLATGQTALRLALDRASRLGLDPDQAAAGDVGFCGLSIANLADVEKLIDGIDLEKTSLYLQSGSSGIVFVAMLAAAARKRGVKLEHMHGAIEEDPISELVIEGALPIPLGRAFDDMAAVTRWALLHLPGFQTAHASGLPFHDGGASAEQELAFALASGVASLREMEKRGFSVDEISSRIRFSLSMDSDFFMSIAKLRAARLLWSRIVAASGGNERSRRMRIHARTALFNKTKLDPYVNMLRVTSEAFAAVLGGCESLQTGAFDEVIRPADEFSRRIARNTQLILRDECHLDRVIDPSGGSYYVEKLTDELARKAWALFRDVETKGGLIAALDAGFPQEQIEAVAAKKTEAVEHRRLSLIGTNVYANVGEKPFDPGDWGLAALQKKRASEIAQARTGADQEVQTAVMAKLAQVMNLSGPELVEVVIEAVARGATLGEISRSLRSQAGEPASTRPIESRRAGIVFEQLRAACDQRTAQTGKRPRVFLACMGPVKQHKARADFAAGFFQAGGFEVQTSPGFKSGQEAVEAAAADGAEIVVLCSSDDTYPELVPVVAGGLKKAARGKILVLAGLPAPEAATQFREAGIDEFIHIRANCAAMLKSLLSRMGVLS